MDRPDHEDNRITLAPGVSVSADDLQFAFSAGSGPGGQNVNRRSTRVTLRVDVNAIPLRDDARERLRKLAGPGRMAGDELLINDGRRRSQRDNKQSCIDRLASLVRIAVQPPTPRKPTKPSRGAKARRLEAKRQHGEKKQRRRQDDW
ncbi:MAG: aminoacyl-tRNA hydrolase [Phycisphaerae bacterium]|nr:aminoacyl-tRNA hydrolase [Phycisphaerae bacterium]|tara:strand:- start:92 stop:532 length:441 start_codon:yes stop_codon:yes gene_type:complete